MFVRTCKEDHRQLIACLAQCARKDLRCNPGDAVGSVAHPTPASLCKGACGVCRNLVGCTIENFDCHNDWGGQGEQILKCGAARRLPRTPRSAAQAVAYKAMSKTQAPVRQLMSSMWQQGGSRHRNAADAPLQAGAERDRAHVAHMPTSTPGCTAIGTLRSRQRSLRPSPLAGTLPFGIAIASARECASDTSVVKGQTNPTPMPNILSICWPGDATLANA